MSGKGLAHGLNISKKPGGARPQPGKRKPIFGNDDSDEEEGKSSNADGFEEIGEFGGISSVKAPSGPTKPTRKSGSTSGPPPKLGLKGKKAPISMYGDLSADLKSKQHAAAAEELDANIYDYDAVYDSLKPVKKTVVEDEEMRPKYMDNLIAAAAVRKRDATIAEERKMAREREEEGEEFAGKEMFVTGAYKRQQEENRRIEAEEREKEERERKKVGKTGMTGFLKNILDRGEEKHAEVVKKVEERLKDGPVSEGIEEEKEKEKTEADLAREINAKKAGSIAINDQGEVVDKRQLLKGGLNIVPKAKSTTTAKKQVEKSAPIADRTTGSGFVGAGGGKQAMRDRQTKMMEAQLEQVTKRAREEEEEERLKIESASKSQKTAGDIMSAKERYLARKREAEEAKKREE